MIIVGTTEIHFVSSEQPLVNVDAIVEEQDTFLLLGSEPVIRDTGGNYTALVRKMEQQKPVEPGRVLVKGTNPVRFIAIIYNIDSKPVCCDEWITKSLKNIFMECNKRKIISLITPLPGIKYGKLSRESVTELFKKVILAEQPGYPEKIFIVHEQE